MVFGITSLSRERPGAAKVLECSAGALGDRERAARAAGRHVEGGRQPGTQGVGAAGDGRVEELDHLLVLLLGQGEPGGDDPALHVPPPRSRRNSCQPQSENETALGYAKASIDTVLAPPYYAIAQADSELRADSVSNVVRDRKPTIYGVTWANLVAISEESSPIVQADNDRDATAILCKVEKRSQPITVDSHRASR